MAPVAVTQSLPDLVGQTVDEGRLRLVARLGSGAYGIVYKALLLSSPKEEPVYYAVKCLKKFAAGSREAEFQIRELKLHRMMSSHPNIITMHRYFIDPDHIFVVLDFCPGGDLFVAITEKHLFRRDTALVKKAFCQILDAVQFCHDNNVFHRDLKPENILCDSQGTQMFLGDFGLSTQSSMCTDIGLGSPFYMSPEAIDLGFNEAYSCRQSDIWALGVILTNMISGRNPWKAAEVGDECYLTFLENNDFLLQSLPISRGVNEILKNCFRREPRARPSIKKLREDVLKLDSFFLSEAELVHASSAQRAIAEFYADPTHPESPEGTLCESPVSDVRSVEVYLYDTPPFDGLLAPPRPVSVTSSDVSDDSTGPATPAHGPTEPTVDVVVPDLPEDENVGSSALFLIDDVAKINLGEAKPTRSLFKRAMQRFRVKATVAS
ncbi:unnamed protein product [Mycena citricolor]|uniref:non-specific serine/threonine protein kinase n=1 Tax=Mycena citricolor TaxID=2018698 RepID=A0AAD2Q4S0_9AGAR|nr:unnamed protein product [Mycena citricolor]